MITDTINDLSFLNPAEFLDHWQGYRRVTRRVIEAFPEDKLFNHSVGGMRPFSAMVNEIISMSWEGVNGIAIGKWKMSWIITPKPMKQILKQVYWHSGIK